MSNKRKKRRRPQREIEEEPLDEEPLDEEPLDEEPLEEEPLDEELLDEDPILLPEENKVSVVEVIIEYEYTIEEVQGDSGEKPQEKEQDRKESSEPVSPKPRIPKRSRPAPRRVVQPPKQAPIVKPHPDTQAQRAPPANNNGLLFSLDSDEEYSDDDLDADEDNIQEVMEQDEEEEDDGEGEDEKPGQKAPSSYDRRQQTVVKVRLDMSELSAHKTPSQYMCPRFDIEKYNPRSKLKILQKKRVWEVNFVDQRYNNMRRKDFFIKKAMNFTKLWKIKMEEEKGTYIIELNFRDMHPYRLKCGSKKDMIRFYELGKLSIPNNIVWSPDLLGDSKKTKKIELKGTINYECHRKGQMVIERKELMGTSFLVSGRFDDLLTCCLTWNLENQALPTNPAQLSKFLKSGADLYVVFLQGTGLKKPEYYLNSFKEYFAKEDCHLVNNTVNGNVHMLIFIYKHHARKVHNVKFVKKQLPKHLGGLPAVIIKFKVNESPVCFVGVQLPPGERNHGVRKQAIEEVLDNSMDGMHHIFLLGDLQYVVSLPHSIAARHVRKKRRELLQFDQLKIQMDKLGVLHGFKEGRLDWFNPTYPCTRGKGFGGRQYIKGKMLSYAGRVLVKSAPGLKADILEYGADHNLTVSSHCPVYSFTRIATQRVHISHFAPPTKKRSIQFTEIYVGGNIGPALKEPQLVFNGEFLEKNQEKTNKQKGKPTSNPRFAKKIIPELVPTKMELEFLASEFVLVSLVDEGVGGGTLIGSCMLALENATKSQRECKFKEALCLGQTFKGYLMGWMVIL